MSLGLDERLRMERAKKKFTQEKVAEAVGVATSTVSAYENGAAVPPSDVLREFCLLYDVSSDYFLGIESGRTIKADGLDENQITVVEAVIQELRRLNTTAQEAPPVSKQQQ